VSDSLRPSPGHLIYLQACLRECAWEVGVLDGESHYKLAREASEHTWRGHVLHNATVSDWSTNSDWRNAW
jgi:hypothetical protein